LVLDWIDDSGDGSPVDAGGSVFFEHQLSFLLLFAVSVRVGEQATFVSNEFVEVDVSELVDLETQV